jgi:hypothetical protein
MKKTKQEIKLRFLLNFRSFFLYTMEKKDLKILYLFFFFNYVHTEHIEIISLSQSFKNINLI